MDITDSRIDDYCHDHTDAEPDHLRALAEWTRAERGDARMLTGRVAGRFLKLLAQLSSARRVLEIGTFTGYSALSLAEGLAEGGRVITCELLAETAAIARRFMDDSPYGDRVEIRVGPALATLDRLEGPFDLAFVDADKRQYPTYYERILELLSPGGLMIFDNTLWSGEVLQPETKDARAIASLNRAVQDDPRVENVLLPVRDGILLIRKRN